MKQQLNVRTEGRQAVPGTAVCRTVVFLPVLRASLLCVVVVLCR